MNILFHSPEETDLATRLAESRRHISGSVILPEEAGYHDARMAWELSVDQHPAAVVVANSASDIVEAVRFAKDVGLGVAVQATGHGVVRPADDCVLILTRQMNKIDVDASAAVATIEPGAKWRKVLENTQPLGLTPLVGSSTDVGAVGYTLGGGFGWLGRKYGLSSDSVIAFELVTGDGRRQRVSRIENPDLFWALRGGGGSLGVVTRMQVQLYPVSTVYGGNLYYEIKDAKAVMTRYRDWIKDMPEELTSSIVLMNFPAEPAVPDSLRGRSGVLVRGCYCGTLAQGEALINEWRSWLPPFIDDFKVMPFMDVGTISNEPVEPTAGHSSSAWLKELSDAAIEVLIQFGISINGSSPLAGTEIRHAGGAVANHAHDTSAYSNRDENLLLRLVGLAPTVEDSLKVKQYMTEFKQALSHCLSGRVYMNFLAGLESQLRVGDGFSPDALRKLSALKARYDPENLFRYSFNIAPVPLPK